MPTTAREYAEGVLATTPSIRHLLIGCEEFAEREVARAAKGVQRHRRATFQSAQLRRWRRMIDELRAVAGGSPTAEVLQAAERLPYGGLACADTLEEVERVASAYMQAIEPRYLVGISEEVVTPAIAFIWLWRDA